MTEFIKFADSTYINASYVRQLWTQVEDQPGVLWWIRAAVANDDGTDQIMTVSHLGSFATETEAQAELADFMQRNAKKLVLE